MSEGAHRATSLGRGRAGPGATDPEVLEQLIADQRRRWQASDREPVERYLEQRPALRDDAEAVLHLIFNEVVLREHRGESPQAEEYQARFPQLAEQLALQFALHRALRP